MGRVGTGEYAERIRKAQSWWPFGRWPRIIDSERGMDLLMNFLGASDRETQKVRNFGCGGSGIVGKLGGYRFGYPLPVGLSCVCKCYGLFP